MSKTSDAALETNFMYIYHALMGLPMALQPMVANLPKASGEISFGSKIYRGNNKKQAALSQIDQDTALNSKIKTLPTKIKAFDAPVVFRAVIDEPTKIYSDSKISVRQLFDTTLATIKFGQKINGKLYLACYVSEENDAGVVDCRTIFFDSELKTKGAGKRTKSELICHHVSALYSYIFLIDKFGVCDEIEANNIISEALLKSKGNPKTYQSMKRQNARNKKEAWEIGGSTSTFNPIPLIEQIETVTENTNNGIHNMIAGRLIWNNAAWEMGKKDKRPKGHFTQVRFIPLTEDDIRDGIEPDFWIDKDFLTLGVANECLSRGTDAEGFLLPPRSFKNVGGADTVKWASGVQEGSKLAYGTMSVYDPILDSTRRKISSKKIVSIYHGRPDNPHEGYEQLIKETIFFSKLQIVEANEPTFANMMLSEGLGYYMIFKDKKAPTFSLLTFESWMQLGVDFNFIHRTKNASHDTVLETIIRCAKDYLYVGQDEPNYVELIHFVPLLQQFLEFDSEDTQKSDLVMMFGYMVLAHDYYISTILNKTSKYDETRMFTHFIHALKGK
jgi:hypothetical protein